MSPTILAIESSCDETAAAVVHCGEVVSNVVATQAVHSSYGGVVPELASRAHQQHVVPVVDQALQQAKVTLNMLNAVAFTRGPGLLGALLVGTSFAKSMALALGIPLIAVHHMHAHALANFIEPPVPSSFPFLCLNVSGGHTQLILAKDYLDMQVLGQTQDDAIGEAFDKVGKCMGLPYPAGPLIDRYAQQGDPHRFTFPNTRMPRLDFSFSGIKTAFLYLLRKHIAQDASFVSKYRNDLCASIQSALVNMVLEKLKLAAEQTGIHTITLAGGVAANSGLRQQLRRLAKAEGWEVFIPALEFCTDNAAMVAMAAHYQYLAKDFCSLDTMPKPRWPINPT
ncbi:MAG: tRNA (adenosine(37)-N6)-threonylcarbamoyltransferase complex transferase subunit TsaD [Bacteroidota bacterium]